MPAIEAPNHASEVAKVKLSDDAASELAERIQGKFDDIFAEADDKPVEKPVEEEKPAEEEPVSADAEKEPEKEEKPATEEKPAEEKPAEEAAADPDAPTLPAAYRRSLKGYEWTDEEIDSALKHGGNGFVATAAKLHATRSKEVGEWAKLGRERQQRQNAPTPAQPAASSVGNPLVPSVDAAALKKQYGDEPLIDKITGPVNAAIAAINKMLPAVQQSHARTQRTEMETLGKQIDDFFSTGEMKEVADVYGTKTDTLTEAQLAERKKILEHADALVGGASMQGRTLTLEQALQLSADALLSGKREQIARDRLAATLKTRQKGLVNKPGSRKAATVADGPLTKDSLAKRVAGDLRKVFK